MYKERFSSKEDGILGQQEGFLRKRTYFFDRRMDFLGRGQIYQEKDSFLGSGRNSQKEQALLGHNITQEDSGLVGNGTEEYEILRKMTAFISKRVDFLGRGRNPQKEYGFLGQKDGLLGKRARFLEAGRISWARGQIYQVKYGFIRKKTWPDSFVRDGFLWDKRTVFSVLPLDDDIVMFGG